MKNILMAGIFFVSLVLFAEEDIYLKLYKLTGGITSFQEQKDVALMQYMDTVFKGIPQEFDGKDQFREEMKQLMSDTLDKLYSEEQIQKDARMLYAKYYTEEEVVELIKFYETPLGRKVSETSPKLIFELLAMMQAKLPEFEKELRPKLDDLFRKWQEKVRADNKAKSEIK